MSKTDQSPAENSEKGDVITLAAYSLISAYTINTNVPSNF